MIENIILREDLEEIDANYQELLTVSKEVLRRKRVNRQHNEEIKGQNKVLQIKIQSMEVEPSRLQKYHKHLMD